MNYMEMNTKQTYTKNPILDSIKRNYIFYIVCIGCMIVLTTYTKASIFKTVFSFIVISFIGYIAHIISHLCEHFNILQIIDTKLNNMLTSPGNLITYIISKFINFYDFHDKIHPLNTQNNI